MAESGVEIYKRFYPWPSRFRLGDPVLVREVTGMDWPEFIAALQAQDAALEEAQEMGGSAEPDQVVTAGLIAVAFWQGNKNMSRERARRAVERLPLEAVEFIEGDDEVPPATADGSKPSTTSSPSADSPEEPAETETPRDSTWAETSLSGSGTPG